MPEASDDLEPAKPDLDFWAAILPGKVADSARRMIALPEALLVSAVLPAPVDSLSNPRPALPAAGSAPRKAAHPGPYRPPSRPPYSGSSKQTPAAPAAAPLPLQVSAPANLGKPQREFILACVSPLTARIPSLFAEQALELTRTGGGRLVVTSEQLTREDIGQLERCLNPMQEQMSVPARAQISVAADARDQGKKK